MTNIRYVYEHDGGFVARAIRWFTKGSYNHVAILFESEDWRSNWVLEAIERGVVARPEKKRKWRAIVTPKYDASNYVRAAARFVGEKYDFRAFFIFAWILLAWRWLRLKVRRPHLSGNAQFCSELCAHTILPVLGNAIEDPQWIDPDTLFKLQCAYPEFYEVKLVDLG